MCLLVCCAPENRNIMSTEEFTALYHKRLLTHAGQIESARIVDHLELVVTLKGGEEFNCYLDNAYSAFMQDPSTIDEVISHYISAGMEAYTSADAPALRENITPVIKDTSWISEIMQTMEESHTGEITIPIHEPLNDDLIILYALDSEHSMRYIVDDDLAELEIDRQNLRDIAIENLKGILPPVEIQGGFGLYIINAGGDYESSLLLLDKIWNGNQFEVNGDIVVSLPVRGLLMVSGTADRETLEKMRHIANESISQSPYRLTEKLFRYRDGEFSEFKE